MHNFDKVPYEYIVNTILKLKNYFGLHFLVLLHKKRMNMRQKRIYNKTLYVWSNKFTQTKKILHNRWF